MNKHEDWSTIADVRSLSETNRTAPDVLSKVQYRV
jgi:hypothetical protein